jgi:hypothetical protein
MPVDTMHDATRGGFGALTGGLFTGVRGSEILRSS